MTTSTIGPGLLLVDTSTADGKVGVIARDRVALAVDRRHRRCLVPLVFTSGVDTLQTLPVALTRYTDTDGTPFYALLMGATTLSIIPVVVVFPFAQGYIVEGITRSGNKG